MCSYGTNATTKFSNYNEKILEAAKSVAESSTKAATAEEVVNLEVDLADKTSNPVTINNPLKTSVTVDEAWLFISAWCGGTYFCKNW